MSVTIRDVAKAAGVSVKTVSRVINDEPWVHGDTRARVQRVIGDLNFHPNALARGLNTNRMRTLGLIVPDIANPFFAKGIDGCATVAERQGYTLFLGSASDDADREASHIRALLAQRVAGLILWVSNLTEVALHEIMHAMKHTCPAVFIDHPLDPAALDRRGYTSLVVAQERVGILATEHLLAEGRARIAHIGASGSGSGQWVGDQRREGYLQALRAHHIEPDERLMCRVGHSTIREGASAASALLAQCPRPDGLFAFNDLIAVGALLACQQVNVRVPEDLAVVGVDDTEMAAVTHPPLTTIRLHQRRTGEQAATLLLELIGGVAASPSLATPLSDVTQSELPELVVRRSSTLRPVPTPSLDDIANAGGDGTALSPDPWLTGPPDPTRGSDGPAHSP